MPRDGQGNYQQPAADFRNQTVIDAVAMEQRLDDLGNEITNSLAKDGQTVPTANLPMGGFRHTNVSDANQRNQYATAGQVQDGGLIFTGQANTSDSGQSFSATLSPAPPALVNGMQIRVRFGSACKAGATLDVNGLGAKKIRRRRGNDYPGTTSNANYGDVLEGEIGTGQHLLLSYHQAQDAWVLDASPYLPGWVHLAFRTWTGGQFVTFPLPPAFTRFRIEVEGAEPSSHGAYLFFQVSVDGGSTYLNAADAYGYSVTTAYNGKFFYAAGVTDGLAVASDVRAARIGVFSEIEFCPEGTLHSGWWRSTFISRPPGETVDVLVLFQGAWNTNNNARMTHIRVGMTTGAIGGRATLLGRV